MNAMLQGFLQGVLTTVGALINAVYVMVAARWGFDADLTFLQAVLIVWCLLSVSDTASKIEEYRLRVSK